MFVTISDPLRWSTMNLPSGTFGIACSMSVVSDSMASAGLRSRAAVSRAKGPSPLCSRNTRVSIGSLENSSCVEMRTASRSTR